jgi:hypothetical protein
MKPGFTLHSIDRIAGRTLPDAFRCFVLDDAQLRELLNEAISTKEFADRCLGLGDPFSFHSGCIVWGRVAKQFGPSCTKTALCAK